MLPKHFGGRSGKRRSRLKRATELPVFKSNGFAAIAGVAEKFKMHGLKLDHATIRTAKLKETVEFYKEYMGFSPGWRPPFPVGGVWLYAQGSDYPILHVIETTEEVPPGGMFDHLAFRGTGLVDYVNKLRAGGQAFEAKRVPETPYTQVHASDPNGVIIEMTFEEQVDQKLLHSDLVLKRLLHIGLVSKRT